MAAKKKSDSPERAAKPAAGATTPRGVASVGRAHQRRGARLGRSAPANRVPPSTKEPAPAAAITPSPAPKGKDEVDAFVRWEGEGGHPSHGATAPPSRNAWGGDAAGGTKRAPTPAPRDARIDPDEDRAGRQPTPAKGRRRGGSTA
jgi:hypothetical protein